MFSIQNLLTGHLNKKQILIELKRLRAHFKVRTYKIRIFRPLPPPCTHFDTYFLLFFYSSLVSTLLVDPSLPSAADEPIGILILCKTFNTCNFFMITSFESFQFKVKYNNFSCHRARLKVRTQLRRREGSDTNLS